MATDRKKILEGLREMQKHCENVVACTQCEINDICIKIDMTVNEACGEIHPCELKLPEE